MFDPLKAMEEERAERMRIAGMPSFPPVDLQLALNRASLRWSAHARMHAIRGPGQHTIAVVLGTNHLLPWSAARVAEHLRDGCGYASIAIELAPSRLTTLREAASILDPVLQELGHVRFRRFPDIRGLQRLCGTTTRYALSERLDDIDLNGMDLRLYSFVEGMELLQAVRLGGRLGIPVHAVDVPPGLSTVQPDVQPQQPGLDVTAAQAAAENPGPPAALRELQARWHSAAFDAMEYGVDRGLVVGDEYFCMKRFSDAWGAPSALAKPIHLPLYLSGHGSEPGVLGIGVAGGQDGSTAAAQRTQQGRELHMAHRILELPQPVLAVVGAAHVAGITRIMRRLVF